MVSVWPRLSETFILNEVLAVEGGGVPLRIFSVKNPVSGPVHARAGDVRAEVTCLGGLGGWRQALGPGLRLARRRGPGIQTGQGPTRLGEGSIAYGPGV